MLSPAVAHCLATQSRGLPVCVAARGGHGNILQSQGADGKESVPPESVRKHLRKSNELKVTAHQGCPYLGLRGLTLGGVRPWESE